ncbi:class I adenylate-forming enzyme family protein [Pseudonocardia parietis]|uniref:Fatty-acyl-CoA synthase n=1 Tax=Pseudonocardia parietis TaxID=570936 RepID=A0ABS4VV26_9PSEU|nr:AMP-binding protein [Pseudonocardia parietis]MBP2367771.1 fatty-acyl-CoA synthase [Pseudonocardia parietis]
MSIPSPTAPAPTDPGPASATTAIPTVAGLLDLRAREHPDRAAIAFPGRTLSYGDLAAASGRAAAHLRTLGVGRGDVVAILSEGDPETVVAILAVARLGAVSLPVNNRFRAGELRHVLDDGDARVLLVTARFADEVNAALPSLAGGRRPVRPAEAPALRHVVDLARLGSAGGDTGAVPDGPDGPGGPDGPDRDDEFVMIYTSGTTSRPRGCLHTHAGYVQQGKEIAQALRLTGADRFWTPLPFFHVGGYDVLLASLWAGCTMVHTGPYAPDVALAQLGELRCTVAFPAFETIWLPVLRHPRFAGTDLSALRVVVNVGPPERMESMQASLPHAVQVSCTGSTESAGFCCIGSLDDPPDVRARTAGRVNPGMEARIVDPATGEPVPDGTPGEFVFRGAYRFVRYHRDPELTARRIDPDGWYHSGDLLVRDDAGRFTFLGRLGDILKVGGENVSPTEVEGHLGTYPGVHMVQVVAAPDDRYGEVPAAFVLLDEGASATPEELIDFCLGAIATFKVPRYVFFVHEWPMSGTKIQKFVLRERAAQFLREQGITEAPRLTSGRRITG